MKLGGGKDWYTAAELAELALPGLPRTKRKVNERAAQEAWALRQGPDGQPLARPRVGVRGGGLEYHTDVLPAAARAALAEQGIAAVAHVSKSLDTTAPAMWRWYEAQSDKTRADAQTRLEVLVAVEAYEGAGMTTTAAVAAAAARHGVAPSTIWGWRQLVEGVARPDWLPYVAPRRCGGGREIEIDDGAWKMLISDYLRPSAPSFSSVYHRIVSEYCAPRGIQLPHERTLRRKLEREIDPRVLVASRQGQEALRQMIPAQRRTVADLHALEVVNIDGHKWDVFVRWPDGTVDRPILVGIQDIYSRKIVSWSIGRSESVVEVRLALARLFARYGIPGAIVLDNGRAFASKQITGGAKTRFRFKVRDEDPLGVLTALGVQIHWAQPYRGSSKPIERAWKDFCDAIAKHPAFEGAYTGNRPDAKPENYGAKAVPLPRFVEIIEAGIAAHNARPGRRTEMGGGQRSFDQVFEESYAIAPIRRATPEQLRMALLAADDRPTDRRTGAIALFGNRYWTEALGSHAGERVTVRFDPDDLHAPIHVYDRAGRFLCTAPVIEDGGFLSVDDARRRARLERDHRRRTRELIEAEQLLDSDRVDQLLTRVAPETLPHPTVVRPVRARGQTAAALKVRPVDLSDAARGAALDQLVAGARRLRAVK